MESAQVDALESVSSVITPKIVTGVLNKLYTSAWDNFNQKVQTGTGMINTAHGQIHQEINNIEGMETGDYVLPEVER